MLPELSDEQRAWYILKGYKIYESPSGKWREWFLNGDPHRHDGPAYEDSDGYKEWYLNGKYLNKQEFIQKVSEIKNYE